MTAAIDEPVTCPCGRELRDPVSRSRGVGPRCWRKLHGPPRQRPTVSSPALARVDGQLAFDDRNPADTWTDGAPIPPRDIWGQHVPDRADIRTVPVTGNYL